MTESNPTAPIFKGRPITGAEAKSPDGDVATSLLAPDMDLAQLIAEIWLHKWLIVGVAAFFFAAATVKALGTPETFRADALIQIENEQTLSKEAEVLSSLAGVGSGTTAEVELIRSRLVLGNAVRNNRYQFDVAPVRPSALIGSLIRIGAPWPRNNPYPTGSDRITVDDLSVPANWVEQKIIIITGQGGSYRAVLPNKSVIEGVVGQPLIDNEKGLTILIGSIKSEPEKKFFLTYKSELSAVQSLRDMLQLGERGRQTGLIELFLDGSYPADAQQRLESIVNSYIQAKAGYSQTKAERLVTMVEAQIPPAEAEIRRAEDALIQYQRQSNTVDVKSESELLVKQLQDISVQLDREQIPRERERLLAIRDNLRRQAQQLPIDQQEVANLTLELQTAQEIYVQLMNRVQAMRVLRASSQSNVRLVDTAVAPAEPVAPRRKLIMLLGLIIGLFTGITIAGFRVVMRPHRAVRS